MFPYRAGGAFGTNAAPVVWVSLRNPIDDQREVKIEALVDTGAHQSCVPDSALEALHGLEYRWVTIKGVTGDTDTTMAVKVDLIAGDCRFDNIEVISVTRDFAILGRDILNRYAVRFDGPGLSWEVGAPTPVAGPPIEIDSLEVEGADTVDSSLVDRALRAHSLYSSLGLVLGSGLATIGAVLCANGAVGSTSWTTSALGLESSLNDAGPGVVMMVVGLVSMWVTKLQVKIKGGAQS